MKAVDKFEYKKAINFQLMLHGGLDKQLQDQSPTKNEQYEYQFI